MAELKKYDATVNGKKTTLLLDGTDAKNRGLTDKDLTPEGKTPAHKAGTAANKAGTADNK